MKLLLLVLTLFSLSSFATEHQKDNKNNELAKNKQKVFEEKCSKFAVQSKIPEKRLSVFMAECMASLSLGNIDEGEESISTNEKPDPSMKKSK
jgi:hypothetical protein